MTFKVLAHELHIPLHTVQVDRLVTKFMGETRAKLRMLRRCVVFSMHSCNLLKKDTSDNIVIAVTNNPQLLDKALFRRFDDILYYKNPTDKEKKQLIKNVLGTFKSASFGWKTILEKSSELSHAELALACNDTIKHAILSDKKKISAANLCVMIANRQDAHKGMNG